MAKTFLIVIPSFNNEWCVERNLVSVLGQAYHDFQLVYIDDASTDHTYDKARGLLEGSDFTLIRNQKRVWAMENIYTALKDAPPDHIAVILDGDDWLAHPYVLTKLDEIYSDPSVWLTYGQYIKYPSFQKGPTFPPPLGKVREREWFLTPLRTFYAGLFQRIRPSDLQIGGRFVQTASDVAMMLPMAEMAAERVRFIDEVLYVYNFENPLSDGVKRPGEQAAVATIIRSRPSYQKLDTLSDTCYIKPHG